MTDPAVDERLALAYEDAALLNEVDVGLLDGREDDIAVEEK
jgi:hypothetical protein